MQNPIGAANGEDCASNSVQWRLRLRPQPLFRDHAGNDRTPFRLDQTREERNFAGFFKVEEVRIIIADGQDVGWIQEQVEDRTINLGSFYVLPAMQRRGIGTKVLDILLARAADQSKAMTLAVVKINPAR